jgi:hypothetical protein
MGRQIGALAVGADVPYFHAGGIVADDEQLAILQDGEGIFTPLQMANVSQLIDALTGANASILARMQELEHLTLVGAVGGGGLGDTIGNIGDVTNEIIVNIEGGELAGANGEEIAEHIVTEIGRQINFGELSAEVRKHTGKRR